MRKRSDGTIRVLPSLPDFRPLFTCKKCGSNIFTMAVSGQVYERMGNDRHLLCAHCQTLNQAVEQPRNF
ncbi:hypothetical protein JXB02_02250 [Candidatus Woesearchaeota archaeon]|nr:hypothetical protein [Candidatus Woesearchaeota archaeon]